MGPTHSQGDDTDTHEHITNALETIASPNSLLTPLHSLLAGPVTPPNTSSLSAATAGDSVVNARGC